MIMTGTILFIVSPINAVSNLIHKLVLIYDGHILIHKEDNNDYDDGYTELDKFIFGDPDEGEMYDWNFSHIVVKISIMFFSFGRSSQIGDLSKSGRICGF